MERQRIGVIGLAVMGRNLALNIAEKGFAVAVFNRTYEKTRELLADSPFANLYGYPSLSQFVNALEKPRKIILMVKAGPPVDQSIELLIPLLDRGDLIIDGGNSFYPDTQRRAAFLDEKGILYLGTGISGGEEGARHGPAIMPGGDEAAYRLVEPIFTAIAAQVGADPCCAYIGPDGAGHFVKMVHNGIEYADMQLIAESYDILRKGLGMAADELQLVFADWNKGELDSYLIEITAHILQKKDERTGKPMVDIILDSAGQKGTGKWTSQVALDLGQAIPTMTEAVFARFISAQKSERVQASAVIKGPDYPIAIDAESKTAFIESVRKALYASKICSYAQGFAMMAVASQANNWKLNLGSIAKIFRGGCIIRARFLNQIAHAYEENPSLVNLLLDEYFLDSLNRYQDSWRETVKFSISHGIPIPGMASAISYFDSYRTANLPMGLLQAQRDYFGAHTYQRTDIEGVFHTEWNAD